MKAHKVGRWNGVARKLAEASPNTGYFPVWPVLLVFGLLALVTGNRFEGVFDAINNIVEFRPVSLVFLTITPAVATMLVYGVTTTDEHRTVGFCIGYVPVTIGVAIVEYTAGHAFPALPLISALIVYVMVRFTQMYRFVDTGEFREGTQYEPGARVADVDKVVDWAVGELVRAPEGRPLLMRVLRSWGAPSAIVWIAGLSMGAGAAIWGLGNVRPLDATSLSEMLIGACAIVLATHLCSRELR